MLYIFQSVTFFFCTAFYFSHKIDSYTFISLFTFMPELCWISNRFVSIAEIEQQDRYVSYLKLNTRSEFNLFEAAICIQFVKSQERFYYRNAIVILIMKYLYGWSWVFSLHFLKRNSKQCVIYEGVSTTLIVNLEEI